MTTITARKLADSDTTDGTHPADKASVLGAQPVRYRSTDRSR